jgi:hypothetical protein
MPDGSNNSGPIPDLRISLKAMLYAWSDTSKEVITAAQASGIDVDRGENLKHAKKLHDREISDMLLILSKVGEKGILQSKIVDSYLGYSNKTKAALATEISRRFMAMKAFGLAEVEPIQANATHVTITAYGDLIAETFDNMYVSYYQQLLIERGK